MLLDVDAKSAEASGKHAMETNMLLFVLFLLLPQAEQVDERGCVFLWIST
jgi:hypothetical protein